MVYKILSTDEVHRKGNTLLPGNKMLRAESEPLHDNYIEFFMRHAMQTYIPNHIKMLPG